MKNLVTFFLLGLFGTFIVNSFTPKGKYKKGISDNIIGYVPIEIENFLKEFHKDKFISATEKKDEKICIKGTTNIFQSDCNNYYNNVWNGGCTIGKEVDGTCGPVAATNFIEYYKNVDGFRTNVDPIRVFCCIEDMALEKKLTSRTKGTNVLNMSSILTNSFKIYSSNSTRTGANKTDMVRNKIRSEIANGKLCILALTDHFCVCCGVTRYEVKYYKNSKKDVIGTKTYEFFIVNDGKMGGPGTRLFYSDYVANDYLFLLNGRHAATYLKR